MIRTDDIARMVPLFAEHRASDDETLVDAICALGIDRAQAIALVDFMPIAFFHAKAAGKILDMPECYVRYSANQKPIGQVRFYDEPVYVAARTFAEEQPDAVDFDSVSMRSAEFNAVNELLEAGTPMERVRLGQSVIMDESPSDSSNSTRPWWQFW